MAIESRFWVVDVEGSGGQPPEIIELAMVEVTDLELTEKKQHWFVCPKHPIQPAATRVHGLTDEDVADGPHIEDIADDILLWLDQASIVGHNVHVEFDILSRSIPYWKPHSAIDTLKLAKVLQPGLVSYGLAKLGAVLGHSEEAARRSGRWHHSAIYDATLTALIFVDLLSSVPVGKRAGILRDADILNPRQASFL